MNKLLQIACHKCGAPNVRTDASTDIEKLLGEIRCGVCNEKLTVSDVQEVFVLPRNVILLSDGLWLEEYVRNIVSKVCSRAYTFIDSLKYGITFVPKSRISSFQFLPRSPKIK